MSEEKQPLNADNTRRKRAPAIHNVARMLMQTKRSKRNGTGASNEIIFHSLVKGLDRGASLLHAAHRDEENQSGRAEMRNRLKLVEAASANLLHVLGVDDPPLYYFLLNNELDEIEDHSGLWRDLHKLHEVVQRARSKIPSRGGRDLAWGDPLAPSAQVLCAMLILEAWRLARGEAPPPGRNADLHEVAEAYWNAANLPPTEHWGNTLAGWRRHLVSADKQSEVWKMKVRSILVPAPVQQRSPPKRHCLDWYGDGTQSTKKQGN